MSVSKADGVEIAPVKESDYDDWAPLFRAYIDFYQSSIPDEQYKKTFDRIVRPDGDLYGIVLRKDGRMIGIANYYTHQTPWSEKKILHLNDLFVDPNERGGGYGRKMIEQVGEHAKELGSLRVEWATKHDNPARKLYDQLAKCDFVEYRMKID